MPKKKADFNAEVRKLLIGVDWPPTERFQLKTASKRGLLIRLTWGDHELISEAIREHVAVFTRNSAWRSQSAMLLRDWNALGDRAMALRRKK